MTFKGFQKTQDSTLTIENAHNYIKRTRATYIQFKSEELLSRQIH